ncbi:uncharacterized protein LOC125941147 [Dermacentor silvarum]|uniref:uncharacterized protein LOC125941147 n=1 Tax=Dermacentor silvarum TaxID=543639 RepID=UPI0021006E8C|nr:uncharacterized protein LOC125941147 [Dermacentor silvarum]
MSGAKRGSQATSHALTAVSLREETSETLQIAAIKLQKVEVLCLLATSQVNATVATLPFIRGLEVVAVTPECDAYQWNRTEELAFFNAIQGRVGLDIALSFSAAVWEAEVHDKAGNPQCTDWTRNSRNIVRCLKENPIEQCENIAVFVTNDTISKMVHYAKSKAVNAFAILNADEIIKTRELNRPFHLLNFTMPVREGLQTKDTQQRAIQLRPPDVHEWASRESGGELVTADTSAEFETEQAETDDAVLGSEHASKSDMV